MSNIIILLSFIGFLIFTGIHLVSVFPKLRDQLIKKMNETKFKVFYSTLSGIGLCLMLSLLYTDGPIYKSAQPLVYENIFVIMYIACLLITAGFVPKNHFKKTLLHPFTLGTMIWGLSHVLINTNLNHIIFFGQLFIFAVLMIIGLLIRDRNVKRIAFLKYDAITVFVGSAMFASIIFSHKYISGVAII